MPAKIPTLYDETHRARWSVNHEASIASMASLANLIGYLEHPDESTDGSFGICMAGGMGNFVSKGLYESIPEVHRPRLNADDAGFTVSFMTGQKATSIGSIIMPIIFFNAETKTKFRIKLYTLVLPSLLVPMFIGRGTALNYLSKEVWKEGTPDFGFEFSPGVMTMVKGNRY